MNTMENKLITTATRAHVHFKDDRKLNAKKKIFNMMVQGKKPKKW
jgi:hypothetical protein